MPDTSKLYVWTGKAATLNSQFDKADPTALIVGHQAGSITIIRTTSAGTSKLSAQTVAIGRMNAQDSEIKTGDAGRPGRQMLVVVGNRGHDEQTDLDIKVGDEFTYQGTRWRVVMVDKAAPGRTRATCEGIRGA